MLPVTGKLISCFKQIFGWPVTLLDDSMSAWTELSVQLSTILKKEKKEIKSTLAYLLNSSSYTLTCVCQCFNGLLMNPQNIFIRYVISFSFTHLPIENLLFKLQGIVWIIKFYLMSVSYKFINELIQMWFWPETLTFLSILSNCAYYYWHNEEIEFLMNRYHSVDCLMFLKIKILEYFKWKCC